MKFLNDIIEKIKTLFNTNPVVTASQKADVKAELMHAVDKAMADGIITAEEVSEIANISKSIDISDEELSKVKRAILLKVIENAQADGKITKEEIELIEMVEDSLPGDISDLDEKIDELEAMILEEDSEDVLEDGEEDESEEEDEEEYESLDEIAARENFTIPTNWEFEESKMPAIIAKMEAIRAIDEDDAVLAKLMGYGFKNEIHYAWYESKLLENPAYNTYLVKGVHEKQKADIQSLAEGELKGELEPVEGVTMQQYAAIQARLMAQEKLADILAELKMETPTWDKIQAEWNARMSRDNTGTLTTIYSQAFMGNTTGQFASAGSQVADSMNLGQNLGDGQDPVPFEKWVEISVSQNFAVQKGIDPQTDIAKFGLSMSDWVNINSYWGQKFAVNAMALMDDYNKFTEKYTQVYQGDSPNADIEF